MERVVVKWGQVLLRLSWITWYIHGICLFIYIIYVYTHDLYLANSGFKGTTLMYNVKPSSCVRLSHLGSWFSKKVSSVFTHFLRMIFGKMNVTLLSKCDENLFIGKSRSFLKLYTKMQNWKENQCFLIQWQINTNTFPFHCIQQLENYFNKETCDKPVKPSTAMPAFVLNFFLKFGGL